MTCLITCLLSVCFLSDTVLRSLELCQLLVSHFVTLTEDSAAPGSKSFRTVLQRLEEIFCVIEKSMVSVMCLCVHRNKISSVQQGKGTKYLIIVSQLTDLLDGRPSPSTNLTHSLP